jgi:hypothetical protein
MKKFIVTENEKKQITKLYGGLISEETETLPSSVIDTESTSQSPAILKTKELVDGINKVLDYYEKNEEGKFLDKQTKGEVNLGPIGSYYKTNLEDIRNGVKNDPTVDEKTKLEVFKMIDGVAKDKLTKFFGDYSEIKTTPHKFDYYTGKKRL